MSRAAAKTPRWRAASGVPPYAVVSRLGGYYGLKYYKQTDFFTTITPDIRDYLIGQGIGAERVRHINNFAEMEENVTPVSRESLQTPQDAFVFLSLSRLHHAKAIDSLLHATVLAPEAWLWIAGEGPDRVALEVLSHNLGLAHRVRFLGWRSDRAALFASANACVFPSRHEPFGTVFVQAWAARRPLVVTAAQGPRQYVNHAQDGLMVPVDDIPALAQAMQAVIHDPALREHLVTWGHARYQSEFTRDGIVSQYLDHYADICRRFGITLLLC
jgi:glycosyltransferase involved in cell wall biosynthesis